jgi:type I restriction-modification system DNA methylase subunit
LLALSPASFKESVEKLVRRFESDRTHYLSKGYPEAQARVDFITPFFKALGWDVENEAGLPHFEREVVVEHGEADAHGRPDYSFRIGGQTKFFVEAKAPSEPLDDPRHILQATGYAWNTKTVFFVVLTNFEEFRFYDGSLTPDQRNPDKGLLFKLTYADYLGSLQKLWEFSQERIAAGSLDAMLPRDRRTERLRIPVDEAFLDEMTGWREELARDIYKNNRDLTARQLNEVVQRLLDRIVFIRIAEDRRIIERYQLRAAAEEWRARGGKFNIFDWLRPLFEKINEDFNGEIFKPNELLEKTDVDSEILARIIERLYPPKSPYRFDVIGVELLGSIYERYLGKTIRPTAKTVRVEEKSEVRKAGGVYYTPKYIVDYIVKNTVGKVIEGKSPKQIEKVRILDPACGSGSFLIGAFQCLIDYHLRWYLDHPKDARVHPLFPDLLKDGGQPRLSVVRKARILHNNLFGVDIDPQAVEITMMSLYLKALEGEKSQLPPKQHVLPELKYNIMCGNSLIGPDIYKNVQLGFFGDEEKERINAFDWNSESSGFDRIICDGGFDCVIGNPPYIFITGMDKTQKEYFGGKYLTWSYRFDVYGLFIERGLDLLKASGKLGFITPHTLLNNDSFTKLRNHLLKNTSLETLLDIGPGVFQGAKNETMVLLLSKAAASKSFKVAVAKTTAKSFGINSMERSVPQAEFATAEGYSFSFSAGKDETALLRKLGIVPTKFGTFFRINQGLRTGDNDKYLSPKRASALHRPAVGGKHVARYYCHSPIYVLYDPKRLDAPRDERNFTSAEKIVVQEIRNITLPRRIVAAYDDKQRYCLQSTNTINWKDGETEPFNIRYALGVLNSALLNWYFRKRFTSNNHIASNQLAELPLVIPVADAQGQMVTLVNRMLDLNRKKHSGKLPSLELDRAEREIAATDAEIDSLVYELYGITGEERKIIEGA